MRRALVSRRAAFPFQPMDILAEHDEVGGPAPSGGSRCRRSELPALDGARIRSSPKKDQQFLDRLQNVLYLFSCVVLREKALRLVPPKRSLAMHPPALKAISPESPKMLDDGGSRNHDRNAGRIPDRNADPGKTIRRFSR